MEKALSSTPGQEGKSKSMRSRRQDCEGDQEGLIILLKVCATSRYQEHTVVLHHDNLKCPGHATLSAAWVISNVGRFSFSGSKP